MATLNWRNSAATPGGQPNSDMYLAGGGGIDASIATPKQQSFHDHSDTDDLDVLLSEITVQFDDGIQTLYVGPVAIVNSDDDDDDANGVGRQRAALADVDVAPIHANRYREEQAIVTLETVGRASQPLPVFLQQQQQQKQQQQQQQYQKRTSQPQQSLIRIKQEEQLRTPVTTNNNQQQQQQTRVKEIEQQKKQQQLLEKQIQKQQRQQKVQQLEQEMQEQNLQLLQLQQKHQLQAAKKLRKQQRKERQQRQQQQQQQQQQTPPVQVSLLRPIIPVQQQQQQQTVTHSTPTAVTQNVASVPLPTNAAIVVTPDDSTQRQRHEKRKATSPLRKKPTGKPVGQADSAVGQAALDVSLTAGNGSNVVIIDRKVGDENSQPSTVERRAVLARPGNQSSNEAVAKIADPIISVEDPRPKAADKEKDKHCAQKPGKDHTQQPAAANKRQSSSPKQDNDSSQLIKRQSPRSKVRNLQYDNQKQQPIKAREISFDSGTKENGSNGSNSTSPSSKAASLVIAKPAVTVAPTEVKEEKNEKTEAPQSGSSRTPVSPKRTSTARSRKGKNRHPREEATTKPLSSAHGEQKRFATEALKDGYQDSTSPGSDSGIENGPPYESVADADTKTKLTLGQQPEKSKTAPKAPTKRTQDIPEPVAQSTRPRRTIRKPARIADAVIVGDDDDEEEDEDGDEDDGDDETGDGGDDEEDDGRRSKRGALSRKSTGPTRVTEIKCRKCDMCFKTELWYKKHLMNFHGIDLSNIAHFLSNLAGLDDGIQDAEIAEIQQQHHQQNGYHHEYSTILPQDNQHLQTQPPDDFQQQQQQQLLHQHHNQNHLQHQHFQQQLPQPEQDVLVPEMLATATDDDGMASKSITGHLDNLTSDPTVAVGNRKRRQTLSSSDDGSGKKIRTGSATSPDTVPAPFPGARLSAKKSTTNRRKEKHVPLNGSDDMQVKAELVIADHVHDARLNGRMELAADRALPSDGDIFVGTYLDEMDEHETIGTEGRRDSGASSSGRAGEKETKETKQTEVKPLVVTPSGGAVDDDDHYGEFSPFEQAKVLENETDNGKCYTCVICRQQFYEVAAIKSHLSVIHAQIKRRSCPHCGRTFVQTGDLTRHIRIHTGVRPFKCPFTECTYAFISSGDLHKHVRRHNTEMPVPKPHVCEYCGKDFERSYDLKRHLSMHLKNEPGFRGIPCELCGKIFARKDQYRAHTYRHIGYKPYKCDNCGKTFSDPSNFAKHTRLHELDGIKVVCNFCSRTFKNKSAISKHIFHCQFKTMGRKRGGQWGDPRRHSVSSGTTASSTDQRPHTDSPDDTSDSDFGDVLAAVARKVASRKSA